MVTTPMTGNGASPRPVRKKPNINLTEAGQQGWSNLYSPNPIDRAGATESENLYGGAPAQGDIAAYLDELFGGRGGGGGPTTAQQRAGGMRAAQIYEQAGRRGQQMYNQQAGRLGAELEALYNPVFQQQQTGLDENRRRALEFLSSQYGGNQQMINDATTAALAGVPQSVAYQNTPIVNLQQEQNPLLSGLAAYGAQDAAVQQQSAADAQLAQQLSDLVKGSAGQLSTAQQAVLDAAKSDIRTGGSAALQQLALNRQAAEAGVESDYSRGLSDFYGNRAGILGDILGARQGLMSQGIESLLGGMTAGAEQRAKTVAEYGPGKKKPKAEPKPKPKPKPKAQPKPKGKGK